MKLTLSQRALKWLIIILAFVFISGAVFWWLIRSPVFEGEGGVTVQHVESCSKELPWSKPPLVEKMSKDSSALAVRIMVNATCGHLEAQFPKATIDGDKVYISWSWVNPNNSPLAACKCTRRLDFRIPQASTISHPKIVIEGAR